MMKMPAYLITVGLLWQKNRKQRESVTESVFKNSEQKLSKTV